MQSLFGRSLLVFTALAAGFLADAPASNVPIRAGSTEEETAPVILVRIAPNADEDTLQYLASLADPERRIIPKGVSLKKLLTTLYGSSHEKIRKIFRQYNPNYPEAGAREAIEVLVPELPHWEFEVEAQPAPQNTYRQLIYLLVGWVGKTTRGDAFKLNPGLEGVLDEPASKPISLSYTTGYMTIRLKPNQADQIDQILTKLQEIGRKGGILKAERSVNLQPVPHWQGASRAMPVVTRKAADSPEWIWLHKQMTNIKLDNRSSKVTIGIVDSGIAMQTWYDPDPRFDYWKTNTSGAKQAGQSHLRY